MSLLKVKVTYISSYNDDGAFREEKAEFLLRAKCFCDAEKATVVIIKDRYHPKEDSDIVVTHISSYGVEPDSIKDDEDLIWFEIHVKIKEMKPDGTATFKVYKYLKQAEDVTDAERLITSELRHGEIFDDFKVVKVIKTNFTEVIA